MSAGSTSRPSSTPKNIDHSRTKTKSPQTNGIVERFHKTMLDEFYRLAFRKTIYSSIGQLQADLDAWMIEYNEVRPHQGRGMHSRTPTTAFVEGIKPEDKPTTKSGDKSRLIFTLARRQLSGHNRICTRYWQKFILS